VGTGLIPTATKLSTHSLPIQPVKTPFGDNIQFGTRKKRCW